MPIIALPWLHTDNNSTEKNVLPLFGTQKEQHEETKVKAVFYRNKERKILWFATFQEDRPWVNLKLREMVKHRISPDMQDSVLKQYTERWDV